MLVVLPEPAGDGSCGDVFPALPGALTVVLPLALGGTGETPPLTPLTLPPPPPPVVPTDAEDEEDTDEANTDDANPDVEADVDVDAEADVDEEDDEACCCNRSRIPFVCTPRGRVGAAPTYPTGLMAPVPSIALLSLDSLCVR